MEYRKLGRSGLDVSSLALGTMTFGRESDEAAAREILSVALDAGVNFIDTANTYAQGASETLLGKLLKGTRQDLVVATKFANPTGKGPNRAGASRLHILNAVNDSLRRLQTDYIDLYYVHHIDPVTPIEETLSALDALVRQGKVRYLACSNYEAWRLLESLWTSETRGYEKFIAHQAHYNILVRDVEDELVPVAVRKGVGLVPWGPLAGGLLTGKYGVDGRVVAGTRSDKGGQGFVNREPYLAPNSAQIIGRLLELATELGRKPGAIALQWLLAKPAVASVLIGARTAAQARENLQDAIGAVPAEALEELEALSSPAPRYPKDAELSRG
jgi:aryl-alcohol dehydrogenase-like predicted oxidoreductase